MGHLIPEQWFEYLARESIWLIFLSLMVSFAVLCKGSDWFVDGAAGIAKKLHIPKVIIGATVVSLGTTSSEAAVSVMAAFQGQPGLALGNGVGSVICDTALIFGLCCCITTLPADKFLLARHGWIQFAAGVIFAGLCYVLLYFGVTYIGRVVGFIMLGLLCCYLLMSIKWAREHDDYVVAAGTDSAEKASIVSILSLLGIFILGLVFVLLGSRVLIGSVTQICIHFGIPDTVPSSSC